MLLFINGQFISVYVALVLIVMFIWWQTLTV